MNDSFRLKLIVFDCDGVMFDSRAANCAYYNHLLSHFQLPPMTREEEDFVHMQSVDESIRHIFRHYQLPSLAEVRQLKDQLAYEPFLRHMVIESDLVEFLTTVYRRYHLAISTNRTNTMLPLLKTYGLSHFFGKVVTAHTARRPKPAPDGLWEILEHFQCRPEEAVFIGDSIIDQQHAAGAGVRLIAFKSPSLAADFHVSSFREILELPIYS